MTNYYAALAMVTIEEKPLLLSHMQNLKLALKPGLDSLNWNSLSVPSFIKKGNQEIARFQSIVNQLQKNSSMIANVVEIIASTKFVSDPVPPPGEDCMEVQVCDASNISSNNDVHLRIYLP
jgi:hypothetical protein